MGVGEALIRYTDVEIHQQELCVLNDVNLELHKGEFVYLVGKVGSGKTSLLKTFYGELDIASGEAEVLGYDMLHIKRKHIPQLRRKLGIVFQDFQLLTDRTVYDNLEFVLRATGWKSKGEIKDKIEEVLNLVGMSNKGYKLPNELSVVTAMPYIFFEVWRFINPALYPNERKGVRKALTIGTGMFFIGVLMGYFMVYPLTLRFLSTYQLSSEVENILSLNSYIDNFMMLILCMGLAFELPLVTWLLSLLGVVNKSFLRKYRRHAVVIIVIAAAIITPTGDPFTLSVVAIPLYLLYEMSILMIKDKKEVPELEEEEEEEGVAKV